MKKAIGIASVALFVGAAMWVRSCLHFPTHEMRTVVGRNDGPVAGMATPVTAVASNRGDSSVIRSGGRVESFSVPFLKNVEGVVKYETLGLRLKHGEALSWPVKTFYSKSGGFLRAEYGAKNAPEYYPTPIDALERLERFDKFVTVGLPSEPAKVSVVQLFGNLANHGLDISTTKRFDLSYLLIENSGKPAAAFYILNLYGVETAVNWRQPGVEVARCSRWVFDSNGTVVFADNSL